MLAPRHQQERHLSALRLLKTGFALAAALAAACAMAEQTVCTVTVNSADEREVFRKYLPEPVYRFVELAQMGQRDWLKSACEAQVRCDVLVVSGHFAGTAFYSSTHGEQLPVDELERVACSASCPDLLSQLKEVYLFGCDSLKDEPVRTHGESAYERMRRIFKDVPVIYGFSSLAPYGRVAGPMLRSHFEAGFGSELGSGVANPKLLKLFAPTSMIATSGAREEHAERRADVCRHYDDAVTPASRLAFMHELLGRDTPELRAEFDRVEAYFASVDEASRASLGYAQATRQLADDVGTRGRYLRTARQTQDPALRVRMLTVARTVGWLTEQTHRAELAAMIGDVLAERSIGFGEVDLICTLNQDRQLDSELARFQVAQTLTTPANAAALACLGSDASRTRVLRALASADESEVQLAQAYLRHRPVADAGELRELVREIRRTRAPAAQARALETVARHHVSDDETLDELAALFAQSRSHAVQRAVAEVFLRSGIGPSPKRAALLREKRLRSPGGSDLIEVVIRKLEGSA